jgi:hypothetical protein
VTNPEPGSWIVRRWAVIDGFLDYEFIESSGTFADAKYLANSDNHANPTR